MFSLQLLVLFCEDKVKVLSIPYSKPTIQTAMKKQLTLLFFSICISFPAFGQFSIQAGYLNMAPNDWEQVTEEDFHKSGYTVGLEYWFRLKNYRLEFYPGVWFNYRSPQTIEAIWQTDVYETKFESNYWSLQFATTFYPLDFEGDCNCPTFSKQGNLIKKGFFIQIVPELGIFNANTHTNSHLVETNTEGQNVYFAIGAGAGLDIGITDLLTITPIFKLSYYPSVSWENGGFLGQELGNTSFLGKQLGLRISLRPDYLRQTGRF